MSGHVPFSKGNQTLLKVDDELGIVFGFAAVSHHYNPELKRVVPYFDLGYTQGGEHYQDHIPDHSILKQGLDFMSHSRVAGDLHKSDAVAALRKALAQLGDVSPEVRAEAEALVKRAEQPSVVDPADRALEKIAPRGDVPFGFPLTMEIADAMSIRSDHYGFLAGIRPDQDLLAKFKSGEYAGFSIGGFRGNDRILGDGDVP